MSVRLKKDYKYLKHAATTHRLNEVKRRRVSDYDRGVFAGFMIGSLATSVFFLIIWMAR